MLAFFHLVILNINLCFKYYDNLRGQKAQKYFTLIFLNLNAEKDANFVPETRRYC